MAGANVRQSMHWKGVESLLKRIAFVLMGIAIYRFGGFFPLPGVDIEGCRAAFKRLQTESSGFLLKLDNFFGGNLTRASIFSVGIQPYITASIIMRLLVLGVPSLKNLQREDSNGRARINQYMRILTCALAIPYSIVIVLGFAGYMGGLYGEYNVNLVLPLHGYTVYIAMVPTLVAWSMFLMWLAEQMTEYGIGNGSSCFILSGQLCNLLGSGYEFFSALRRGNLGLASGAVFVIALLSLIYCVVFFERTYRRIPISFPERKVLYKHSSKQTISSLPMKFNIADIMPAFVASTFMSLLYAGVSFLDRRFSNTWVFNLLHYHLKEGMIGHSICTALVLSAAIFIYASINFDCVETADHLKRDSAFIAGVRPGYKTAMYLEGVSIKLIKLSLIYVVSLVCVVPAIFGMGWGSDYEIKGITILLTVSILLDMLDNVVTHLYTHRYESILKRSSFWKVKRKH